MDKLNMQTANIADENFAKLTALFPNAVTETIDENGRVVRAIDADVLAQEINTHVVSGREERYQFTWPDKKKAILLANSTIAATSRPCRKESVDFDNTENLYIEGDNLDVLKLLRETYLNRIKMIYIDPPYNTGNDFIYEDDFTDNTEDFLRRDGYYDEEGNKLRTNRDSNGRFHTDWLNMMYPRLRIARDLLTENGVIFISIDDNEVDNLKKICDEIFGHQNFIGTLVRKVMEGGKSDSIGIAVEHEYCHVYVKTSKEGIYKRKSEKLDHYNKKDKHFDERGYYYLKPLENGGLGYVPSLDYAIKGPDGVDIYPGGFHGDNGYRWVWSEKKLKRAMELDMIEFVPSQSDKNKYKVYYKIYEKVDTDGKPCVKELPYQSIYLDGFTNRQAINDIKKTFENTRIFDYPKPISFLQELCRMATKGTDIILDFFSGSATTAHAVMQLNAEDGGKRKFIMVQLPELCPEGSEAAKAGYKNICEIGRERIRRAGKKIKEEYKDKPGIDNLDVGFRVLKLDSSNMKGVYYTPEEYAQRQFTLDGYEDNIKEDRTPEDLLFQVMLELGIPLSAKIRQDGDIFYVDDNYLIACFSRVETNLITEIAKMKPYYAVFRDSSFESDSALVNFEQIFRTYSPTTERRVL